MALHDKVNYNTILANLSREINKLNIETEALGGTYAKLFDTKDSIDKLRGYEIVITDLISSYNDFSSYWVKYCNMFNEANESEDKMLTAIRIQHNNMVDTYNSLAAKMIEIIEHLNNNSNNMNIIAEAIDKLDDSVIELKDSNKDMLNTLDEASSSIVYNRATKVKGEHNPNTKRSINTNDLIHDYIAAGCVLSNEVVAKYNAIERVTYHGLRKRLVDAGVWQNKHNK